MCGVSCCKMQGSGPGSGLDDDAAQLCALRGNNSRVSYSHFCTAVGYTGHIGAIISASVGLVGCVCRRDAVV